MPSPLKRNKQHKPHLLHILIQTQSDRNNHAKYVQEIEIIWSLSIFIYEGSLRP